MADGVPLSMLDHSLGSSLSVQPDTGRLRLLGITFPVLFALLFLVPESVARPVSYAVMLAGIWAFWSVWPLAAIVRTRPFWLVCGYLSFALLSVAWSGRGGGAFFENFGKYANMLIFVMLVAGFTVAAPGLLRRCERVFVLAGVLSAAIALLMHVLGGAAAQGERMLGFGSLWNSVVAGILYGAALLYCFFREWPEAERPGKKLAVACGALLLMTAVLLTQSRGPIMAVALCLVAGLFGSGKSGRWTVLVFLAAGIGLITLLDGWQGLLERGLSYRIDIWVQAVERWSTDVWFGIGIAARPLFYLGNGFSATSPHNIFLAALLSTGVVGLVLLVGSFLVLIYLAFRQMTVSGDRLALALLLYVVIYGLVDRQIDLRNISPEYFTLWYAAGLMIGFQVLRQKTVPKTALSPDKTPVKRRPV